MVSIPPHPPKHACNRVHPAGIGSGHPMPSPVLQPMGSGPWRWDRDGHSLSLQLTGTGCPTVGNGGTQGGEDIFSVIK